MRASTWAPLLACTSAVSVAQIATAQRLRSGESASVASSGCVMMQMSLPHLDTFVVAVPSPTCGRVRLVVTGATRLVEPGMGIRFFETPIVLENVSNQHVRMPLEMRPDSVTPVSGARQFASPFGGGLIDLPYSWSFDVVKDSGAKPRAGSASDALLPGQRSAAYMLQVVPKPFMRTIRVWLDVRFEPRSLARAPVARGASPQLIAPITIDAAARQLVARSRFPTLRSVTGIYEDRRRHVLIFRAAYGEPHDCPAGCFFSSAIGISYRGLAGWLDLNNYERSDSLPARVEALKFGSSRNRVGEFHAI